MNDDTRRVDTEKLEELAKLRVVMTVPGMRDVQIRQNIPYGTQTEENLGIDVYLPANSSGPAPVVLFVAGYSDSSARDLIGLELGLKEWGSYISWGQLVAASGLVGITYSCAAPPQDVKEVLSFVRDHADEFNVDPERIGIWAASGNGPTALSLLMDQRARLRFAVMCNTYMLDLDGDTTVADMAAQFGFAAPNSGKSVRDLDPDVPIFLVRSGKDEAPGLNHTIDRFIDRAVESNLPVRFVNLPDAPHSFDTLHDTNESKDTIRQIVAFMRASCEM